MYRTDSHICKYALYLLLIIYIYIYSVHRDTCKLRCCCSSLCCHCRCCWIAVSQTLSSLSSISSKQQMPTKSWIIAAQFESTNIQNIPEVASVPTCIMYLFGGVIHVMVFDSFAVLFTSKQCLSAPLE